MATENQPSGPTPARSYIDRRVLLLGGLGIAVIGDWTDFWQLPRISDPFSSSDASLPIPTSPAIAKPVVAPNTFSQPTAFVRPTLEATKAPTAEPTLVLQTHQGWEQVMKDSLEFEKWANDTTKQGFHISMQDYGEDGLSARVLVQEGVKIRWNPDVNSETNYYQPWLSYGQEFKTRYELEVIKSGEADMLWLPVYQPTRDLNGLIDFEAEKKLAGFSMSFLDKGASTERFIDTNPIDPSNFGRFYTWEDI